MTHSAQPELEWNGNYPVNRSNLCLRNHDAQLCISSTFKNCSGDVKPMMERKLALIFLSR